jgi:hypothetical protein
MGTAGIGTSQPLPVGSLALKEDKSNKGAASGYAPLDSGSKVPVANLPAATHSVPGTQSAADYSKLAALPSAALVEDCANDFDPTVAPGLDRRCGLKLGTLDGSKAWIKVTALGGVATGWEPVHSS